MTVSYALTVSSVSYCAFLKLLRKWRGSILKAVWAELLVWLILYAIIAIIINLCCPIEAVRHISNELARLNGHLESLDLKFMLGFFVTIVVDRWKTILQNISFIETVALSVSTIIRGKDDNVRLARRSIVRYLVLSQQKYIDAPVSTNNVLNNIRDFRIQLENLCKFDWVPIPIAYPQVVFLAVRIVFFLALFTRQYIPVDEFGLWYRYIPLMPAMSFLFYVGWMKVAEGLLNSFGEDDDDFEGNWVIDKNITTGMEIVDGSHAECPDLNIDRFADPKFGPMYPILLENATNNLQGSAADVVIPETSRMVHVDSQSSMASESNNQPRQSSIRRRFQRLSSRLKLGRTTSAPRITIKSPAADSTHSAFSNLEFVTEESEDPRADMRIEMDNSERGKK
ncbi:unnamed protein product [Caenorhabditis sp. 36 PRJEB53466]|nr:unnamed protein product [Caenorhabditis sp. 36 PRJEB53466]